MAILAAPDTMAIEPLRLAYFACSSVAWRPLVLSEASTSIGAAPIPCTFACKNFAIVSFCFSGPCVSISRHSPRYRQIYGGPLAALPRVSPSSPPRLFSQLAWAQANSPATVCSEEGNGNHTCVVQPSPRIQRHFRLSVAHDLESFDAVFHEGNRVSM